MNVFLQEEFTAVKALLHEMSSHEARKSVRVKTYVESVMDQLNQADLIRGDLTVYNILRDLESFDNAISPEGHRTYRSSDQRKLQMYVLSCWLPRIYGTQTYVENEPEICRKWGLLPAKKLAVGTFPRRGGKSESMAQQYSVGIRNIPNFDSALFAPSSRAGASESGMAQHIMRLLERHFNMGSAIDKNKARILLRISNTDERRMFFYSCYANNLYVSCK